MSISSAIQNAQTKVANAYTAVEGKGGTLPITQNLSNLPTAISSIPSGGGGSTWQVVEGIITNSTGLDFATIYNPNSEYPTTSGNFIYLVFDNGTLLFATPAYKNNGTLRDTGVLSLEEEDCYATCSILDEISIVDEYGILGVQGYDSSGSQISGAVYIAWTDPTA